LNHHGLDWQFGAANALLDDVGAELLLRQLDDLALEALTHGRSELVLVQVENVLHDIVAKGILNQMEAVRSDLANKLDLLEAVGMIDATLKDAATMTVSANGDAMLAHSIEDEMGILGVEVVQALLDDVIAIQVLNEINNLAREGVNDHLSLRIC
jgi:ABC-type ATPase with predicted acetyltransferase domain